MIVRKLLFSLLIVTLVALPLLAGCNGDDATTEPTTEPTSAPVETNPAETGSGNWWDTFGEPKYGGTLTVRIATDGDHKPDPYGWGGNSLAHWEALFNRDWTVSREIYDFQLEWAPVEYYASGLAESWEYTDPTTIQVHIREGVYWPNEEPLNGRELTADDVVYSYNRILAIGGGFTEASSYYSSAHSNIAAVTATDDHTVEFTLANDSYFSIYDVFGGGFFGICIHARELVDGGYLETFDTASAAGSGPFVLSECSNGVSKVFTRNENYWGYDERYPENQLPYVDTLKYLVIPDTNTALAALRSGQLDVLSQMNTLSWQQADALAKSNPDIQQSTWPSPGQAIHLRVDNEPFTDIKVRKALQLALDLETIAATHYGGLTNDFPEGLVSTRFTGWTLPYDEWPAELQAEYVYDPEQARALLAEAGYPEGFETNIVASSSSEDLELLEIIKAYFMDIGVDMTINTMDFAAKRVYCASDKHDQMSYWNTSGTTRPPQNDIIQHMTDGGGATNANDPVYDEMVAMTLAAATEEEAKQLSIECDQYVLEQHWQVSVFSTVSPIVWQPWVKGNSGEFWNGTLGPFYFARWWIDEDLK